MLKLSHRMYGGNKRSRVYFKSRLKVAVSAEESRTEPEPLAPHSFYIRALANASANVELLMVGKFTFTLMTI